MGGGAGALWIDSSRLDNGKVGAACAWKTPSRWTGRRFHLGTSKVFCAEVYAICRALSVIDRKQESGHRYTVFVDSTSAIDRIRSDALGPGQRFAIASIEACGRIMERNNEVTIRWVLAHQGVEGNERADKLARSAAEGGNPDSSVLDEYRWETSLSHMAKAATEAWFRPTAQWVSDHVDPERKYRPPSGKGLRRKPFRRARKSISSRHYQLMSGHPTIGPYLEYKIRKTDDRYWWCGGGKQQTHRHFLTDCRALFPQIRRLWKDIGKACRWKHPKAPSAKWKEKATKAVLVFLGDTRLGCFSTRRKPPEEERDGEGSDGEREEGGPGHPKCVSCISFLCSGETREKAAPFLCSFICLFLRFPLSCGQWGQGDRGALLGLIGSVWDRIWSCVKAVVNSRCHTQSCQVMVM